MKIGEWNNLGKARGLIQRQLGELGSDEYAAHVGVNPDNGRMRVFVATDVGLLDYSYAPSAPIRRATGSCADRSIAGPPSVACVSRPMRSSTRPPAATRRSGGWSRRIRRSTSWPTPTPAKGRSRRCSRSREPASSTRPEDLAQYSSITYGVELALGSALVVVVDGVVVDGALELPAPPASGRPASCRERAWPP